jgi:hypothetical protein
VLAGNTLEVKQCENCSHAFSDQEVADEIANFQARKAALAQKKQQGRQKTRKISSKVLLVLGGLGVLVGFIFGVALMASATTTDQAAQNYPYGILPSLLLCSGPQLLGGGALIYFGLRSRRANQIPEQAAPQVDPPMNPEPVPQPAIENSAQLEKVAHD